MLAVVSAKCVWGLGLASWRGWVNSTARGDTWTWTLGPFFGKPRGWEGPAGCDDRPFSSHGVLTPWGLRWLPGHTCTTGRGWTLACRVLWLPQTRGFAYLLEGEEARKLVQTRACCEMAIWIPAERNGGKYVTNAGGPEHLIARGNQGNQTLRVFKWQLRWSWHFSFNPWAESDRRESASNVVLSLVYSRHIL